MSTRKRASAYKNHEGFQVQNSTTNADAHLLRLFLAVEANPKDVLATFHVSNAFLNAELDEDVVILTHLRAPTRRCGIP